MIITNEILDEIELEINNSPDGKMSKLNMAMIVEQSKKDIEAHDKLIQEQQLGTDTWSVGFRNNIKGIK
jgi:hypothetical protein